MISTTGIGKRINPLRAKPKIRRKAFCFETSRPVNVIHRLCLLPPGLCIGYDDGIQHDPPVKHRSSFAELADTAIKVALQRADQLLTAFDFCRPHDLLYVKVHAMGVSQGMDNHLKMRELFEFLAAEFCVRAFVETGTYLGGTARWATGKFQTVFTIEGSEVMYERAAENLADLPTLHRYLGDSRDHLPNIVRRIGQEAAIFWLDAHWSGGDTAGSHDECPLLEEIDIISASDCLALIVIDDARFFTGTPPAPHDPSQWPSYESVADALNPVPSHRCVTLYHDAIIAIPHKYQGVLESFVRNPAGCLKPDAKWSMRRWWKNWLGHQRRSA